MFTAIIEEGDITEYRVVASRTEQGVPPGTQIVEIPSKAYASGEEFVNAIKEAQGNDPTK
jgi:hypothetical protein